MSHRAPYQSLRDIKYSYQEFGVWFARERNQPFRVRCEGMGVAPGAILFLREWEASRWDGITLILTDAEGTRRACAEDNFEKYFSPVEPEEAS